MAHGRLKCRLPAHTAQNWETAVTLWKIPAHSDGFGSRDDVWPTLAPRQTLHAKCLPRSYVLIFPVALVEVDILSTLGLPSPARRIYNDSQKPDSVTKLITTDISGLSASSSTSDAEVV